MFEYSKGYEIDGSDSSYNLATPNINKLKEFISYFLSIKVIRKDEPIAIIYDVYKGSKLAEKVTKIYGRNNTSQALSEIEYAFSIGCKRIRLIFCYTDTIDLYPDTKREIIDFIRSEKNKNINLNNPVFVPTFRSRSDLFISIEDGKFDIDDYIKDYIGNPSNEYISLFDDTSFFNINVSIYLVSSNNNYRLPALIPSYVMYKLCQRFSEFGVVDAKETFSDEIFFEVNYDDFIYEEISLDNLNIKDAIDFILSNEKISILAKLLISKKLSDDILMTGHDYKQKWEAIHKKGFDYYFGSYNKENFFPYEDVEDISVEKYIEIGKKLLTDKKISNYILVHITIITLLVKTDNDEFTAFMYLKKEDNRLSLKISTEFLSYKILKQILNIK